MPAFASSSPSFNGASARRFVSAGCADVWGAQLGFTEQVPLGQGAPVTVCLRPEDVVDKRVMRFMGEGSGWNYIAMEQAIADRIAALPGVSSAALASVPILAGDEWDNTMTPQGYTPKDGENMQAFMNALSPGYFATMRSGVYFALVTLAIAELFHSLAPRLEDLFGGGEFWENVDWSRTRAYAMGLGQIYFNLRGREGQGSGGGGRQHRRPSFR